MIEEISNSQQNKSAQEYKSEKKSQTSDDSDEELNDINEEMKILAASRALKLENRRQFLVASTAFTFQITDYFKFQNRQQLQSEHTIFRDVTQQQYIAWIILIYSVISSAMIPPWLMTVKADKLLRISWKCFLQLVTMVPFVLYQKRNGGQKTTKQYKLIHIFNLRNIKKVWLLAFTASFWPTTILTSIEWTYISHSMVLGSLANLYLSIERTLKGSTGKMQKGGQLTVIVGMMFVIYDSIQLDVSKATEFEWNVFNYFYLTRNWWQRVLGDLGAIFIGYCMSQLSKLTTDIKQYYPPYLLLFLNNLFTCIFMIFSAYFFNGATFDFNSQWGVFALFSDKHFTNFLYMSLLLDMGVFISFVMVTKIFPDPIVPALVLTMEPIISTVLFHFAGVQTIPGPYACFGYLIIIPGMMIILTGNCLQTRTKAKEKEGIKLPMIQMKPMDKVTSIQSQKEDFFYDNKQY